MKNIPLISTIITAGLSILFGGLGVWLIETNFNQPRIEWDSRPHYKILDYAIGNIYLENTGRKTDHKIAITLDGNLNQKDIKIVDITSPYKILNNDNKTTILIDELKPQESADITYIDPQNRDDIEIHSFISESSNIHYIHENKWWEFSSWYNAIFIGLILIIISFISGLITGKRISSRRKMQKMIEDILNKS